jgi:small subunit ribosomal protein S15
MARLHSKKKGKSGTKRPKSKKAPEFAGEDAAKVKELILKMSKEGIPASKIGLVLRDLHNVPSVRAITGSRLSAILKKEHALPEYPEDLLSLIKKAVRVRFHLKSAKPDIHNKVKLLHIESKINRLGKYYVNSGRLPRNWKYDPESATLMVK